MDISTCMKRHYIQALRQHQILEQLLECHNSPNLRQHEHRPGNPNQHLAVLPLPKPPNMWAFPILLLPTLAKLISKALQFQKSVILRKVWMLFMLFCFQAKISWNYRKFWTDLHRREFDSTRNEFQSFGNRNENQLGKVIAFQFQISILIRN